MKTERVLSLLRIVAWVVYIGAIIRAVLMTVVIVRSFFLPEKFNFLRENATTMDSLPIDQSGMVLLVVSLSFTIMVLYIQLWEKVKNLLTEINLSNPFTMQVASQLLNTSYVLLSIWIISFIGKNYSHYLYKRVPEIGSVVRSLDSDLTGFDASGVYLLTAGIVYIVAQVFRRGVELQQENELTI